MLKLLVKSTTSHWFNNIKRYNKIKCNSAQSEKSEKDEQNNKPATADHKKNTQIPTLDGSRWNKWQFEKKVFSYLLKASTEAALPRPIRRAFHSVGVTTSKAWSPFVLSLVQGTTKKPWSEDLYDLLLIKGWSNWIYTGAWPCTALYVKTWPNLLFSNVKKVISAWC